MGVHEFTAEELSRPLPAFLAFDPNECAGRVAARYGVTATDVLGPRKTGTIPAARHALYRELAAHGWSTVQIGAFVGGRHHSSVRDALKRGAT
jgi:chromosomal replication initiation ATPase DnaA